MVQLLLYGSLSHSSRHTNGVAAATVVAAILVTVMPAVTEAGIVGVEAIVTAVEAEVIGEIREAPVAIATVPAILLVGEVPAPATVTLLLAVMVAAAALAATVIVIVAAKWQ